MEAKEDIEDFTEASDRAEDQRAAERYFGVSETEQFDFQQWRGREINSMLGGENV